MTGSGFSTGGRRLAFQCLRQAKAEDLAVKGARKAGHFYKLLLRPGVGTPDWVYETGCRQFDTMGINPHREDTFNKPLRIPIPWDPICLREFERFITAVGRRYSDDPLCRGVALTGTNFQSGEVHLPKKAPGDLEKWEKLDYRSKLSETYDSTSTCLPEPSLVRNSAFMSPLPSETTMV